MLCSVAEILYVLKDCTAFFALKMEATLFSPPKTLVNFYQITWHDILEAVIFLVHFHSHCHGNLKCCRAPVVYLSSSVSHIAL